MATASSYPLNGRTQRPILDGVVFDVGQADFEERVVARSREVPVVVDFWAAWCAPCRALTPALEKAAASREGKVDLAKVDVDQNQALAQTFRVQGIPAVKAFRDGQVVDEFTGALPPQQVERFFDRLVPSEEELAADAAVESGDEEALRRLLEGGRRDPRAATALARIFLARGEYEDALGVLEPYENDFAAAGLAARARLELGDEAPHSAFEAWDRGDHAGALDELQSAFESADGDVRDELRRVMIGIFTELGPDSELAREHRRRLSAVLY
jgi:putative thioredoxin